MVFVAKKHLVLYGSVLLLVILGASAFAGSLAEGAHFVRIFINGKEVLEPGDAYLVNGRTFAPVRAIAEALGAFVGWDDGSQTVRITTDPSVPGQEMRISLLEKVLLPGSPEEAVVKWAEGVKSRNGALEFAVMSPELREEKLEYFESLGWVTGTSSPWVENYEITEQSETPDGDWLYKVEFAFATSTGNAGTLLSEVLVKQYEDAWLVAQISDEFTPPEVEAAYTGGVVKQIESGERPRFLLEGGPMSNGEPFLIWLSVNEDTKFCIVEASEENGVDVEECIEASFSDLEVGQKVRVHIPGPILESYPAQGGASEVLILK